MKHTSLYKNATGDIWEATTIDTLFLERKSQEVEFEEEDCGCFDGAEDTFLRKAKKYIGKGYVLDRSSWDLEESENIFLNFLEKLEGKYQKLNNHPEVFFTHYQINPPATKEIIEEQEEYLGFPLPKDLKDFYKIANGLIFRWIHKKGKNEKEVFKLNSIPINKLVTDYLYPPECFNILPLEKIIDLRQTPNWDAGDGWGEETIFYLLDQRNMYSDNLAFRFDRKTGEYFYGTDHDHFAIIDDVKYPSHNFKDYINLRVLKHWEKKEIDALVGK